MKLTELRQRPVVDVSTARTVARVEGVAVDAGTRRVVGFHLGHSEGGDWIAWSDVKAVGADAITISDVSRLQAAADVDKELAQRTAKALGGLVLDDQGVARGHLRDLELDERSGEVTGIVIDGVEEPLPGHSLLGVGRHATVVGTALPPPRPGSAAGPAAQ